MDKNRTYILASGSPRRIEMMRRHGIEPIIRPADIEENIPPECGMEQTVMFLALKKAKAVEAKYLAAAGNLCESDLQSENQSGSHPESMAGDLPESHTENGTENSPVIIAADTIVYKEEIMGKPADRAEARKMLEKLQGSRHYVVTGCALLEAGAQNARVFAEVTEVFVNKLSPENIETYLDTEEPYDKAGAYAIQGIFAKHIDHIEGDYDNVVGFPWSRIEKELALL